MIETRPRWVKRWPRAEPVWRCGWCKGFIHRALVSGMSRFVHDEEPLTKHEVLPYAAS